MAILIKDPETDRIVRELAARTGETITEAVRKAAEERTRSLQDRPGRVDRARLDETLQRFWDAQKQPRPALDDLVVYDENGLPV